MANDMQNDFQSPSFEIFPWNSNFCVGVEFIDEQHRTLVKLLNNVIALFITQDDDAANKAALDEMLAYAHFHFDEEEKLWRKHFGNAALANDHAASHQSFFEEIKVLVASLEAGQSGPDKLIAYLTNWLAVHILHSDRRMATMVLEIQTNGCSIGEAERKAKEKINQMPVLQSSLVELYKKLSISASQLIKEKNARLKAEDNLYKLLEDKAEENLQLLAKEYQAHLEFLAYNDPVTGLLNANGLHRDLRKMMSSISTSTESLAVISINLDYFGQVSVQLGSEGTNRLLGLLAKRWQDALMPNGAIAHLGSDDFVVLLKNAKLVDEQLNALYLAASQPLSIDEWQNQVSFTAGYCIYPQHSLDSELDAEKLHRQADYALFQAKQETRGSYRMFDVEEERKRQQKSIEILRIKDGFSAREFELYYQPKTNMRTGEIVGVEALIRWNHPTRGLLAPAEFLPVLDAHPFIIDLGVWVIETAIQQILHWGDEGIRLQVSVNIDSLQLQSPNFPASLKTMLDKYPECDTTLLELEILETVAINDIELAISNIQQCRNLGVNFSLDDFGKGYCSLSYLKQLPVSTLKIDQAFVRNMLDDETNISILEGIIAIAKTFKLKVIAEGVESVMHGEFLIQIGCEFAQGYAIARPMPSHLLKSWLVEWETFSEWRHSSTLRRDDIAALAGLAELNRWINQLQEVEKRPFSTIPPSDFHSSSLECWMRNSLEERPSVDLKTVQQIETNYRRLLDLGKSLKQTGPIESSEPSSTLRDLTEQIRVGLQECLHRRNQRQARPH